MQNVLAKEESYVERRKLFKNVWDTTMHMNEKEADNITKPKIIKTVRVDEMNRINVGRTKKQRFKNLRNVCNRLLDFRQQAEYAFYEQLASESNGPKPKRLKRHKRKIRRAKSYSVTVNPPPAAPNSSSPNQVKRTTIVKKACQGGSIRDLLNRQTSLVGEPGNVTSRGKVKKKPSKKKSIKGQSTGKIKISR